MKSNSRIKLGPLLMVGLLLGFGPVAGQEPTPSIQHALGASGLNSLLRGRVVDIGAEFLLGEGFEGDTWGPMYIGGKRTFSGRLSVDGISLKRWIFVRNQSEFMFPLSDWLSSKNKNVTTLVFGRKSLQMLPFERMSPQEQALVEDFCAQGLQVYGLPQVMNATEYRESQPGLSRMLVPVCTPAPSVSTQPGQSLITSTGTPTSHSQPDSVNQIQGLVGSAIMIDLWMTGLALRKNELVKTAGRSNLTNYGLRPNGERYAGYFVGGIPLQTWLKTYGSARGAGPYGAGWKLALYKPLYASYDVLSPDQKSLLQYSCRLGLNVYDSGDGNYESPNSVCGRQEQISSGKGGTTAELSGPRISTAQSSDARMNAVAVDAVSGARLTVVLIDDSKQGASGDSFAVVVGSERLALKEWYAKYGVNSNGHVKYGIVLLPLERATSYDNLGFAERTLVWNFCWAGLNIYEHTAMDPRTSQFPLPGRVSACRLLPQVPAPNSESEQHQLRLQYDAFQGRQFSEAALQKQVTHQKPVFVPAFQVYEATDLTRPTGRIVTEVVWLVGDTDGQSIYYGLFTEGPNSLNPRGQWTLAADWLRYNAKSRSVVLFRKEDPGSYQNLQLEQKAVLRGFCHEGIPVYERVDTRQRVPGSFRSSEMVPVCDH